MPEQGDDQKPVFDPRPPGQRRRSGDDSDTSRKGRRSRTQGDGKSGKKASVIGRLTGRAELDRAKRQRYDPYSYESNGTQIKWVVAALIAWSVVALLLAW
ncbi:MAG: hypothetical protein V3T49_05595, partial [Dehalococcoidia bacterium]